jgi:hypothetical protein
MLCMIMIQEHIQAAFNLSDTLSVEAFLGYSKEGIRGMGHEAIRTKECKSTTTKSKRCK